MPLSQNFDLIIFDCDGTLVDSEYLNNLATIQILHEEGLAHYDMDYAFAHFVGLRLTAILAQIERDTGHTFPPDIGPRYVRRAEDLMPEYLKPIAGAEELVKAAAGRAKICVASNGQRDNVVSSLEKTGLKKYFPDDDIFTAAQVENGKPAPDLFLFAAKRMNAAPARCAVIEDSIPGVTGAQAAGMKVFGFVNEHQNLSGYGARLKTAGAAEVFLSLAALQKYLLA